MRFGIVRGEGNVVVIFRGVKTGIIMLMQLFKIAHSGFFVADVIEYADKTCFILSIYFFEFNQNWWRFFYDKCIKEERAAIMHLQNFFPLIVIDNRRQLK